MMPLKTMPKKYFILFAAQILILLFCTAGLFKKGKDLEMDASFFSSASGVFDEEKGGWYIDSSYGAEAGTFLESAPLSLPAGVYRVSLIYETDTDMQNRCTVKDPSASLEGVLTNGDHLYAGLNSTDYEVWILDGNGSLQAEVSYGGTGRLLVKGFRIHDTGALQRIIFFLALLLSVCADLLFLYRMRRSEKRLDTESKLIFTGLALIVFVSSFPLMTNFLINGGDLAFHLLRIEGVKDGLLSGQFPVRIAPEWQRGNGYASSVFYGDALLLIPALLRLIGFPIQTSYKLFLFFLNAGTCLISYYCFSRICRNRYIGVLCSMMYTLSIYRLFKIYRSAALGEAASLLFPPLILLGLYLIFTEDTKAPGYRHNWIFPVIGFCGMIQSHVLSTYLVSSFVIILCLLLWKKTFRKETFMVLLKTVLITSLACAWFIVPFLDYMSDGDFVVNHISARLIQHRGLQPAQLFKLFFHAGSNCFYYENGMIDADPVGVGGALLAGLVLFLFLKWNKTWDRLEKKMQKAGTLAALLALLAMAMSTQLFPWDRIQRLCPLTEAMTGPLEFPSRFLLVAVLLLVLVTGIAGVYIWNHHSRAGRISFIAGILVLTLVGNVFLINDICDKYAFLRLYNIGGMGTGYISSGEYLPFGTDPALLTYREPSAGDKVTVSSWQKSYLTVTADCENHSPDESFLDLPLLHYKGYRAESDAGEKLYVCAGANNAVRVLIPGSFTGRISVSFASPWYWRAAEAVSWTTYIAFAVCLMRSRSVFRRKARI